MRCCRAVVLCGLLAGCASPSDDPQSGDQTSTFATTEDLGTSPPGEATEDTGRSDGPEGGIEWLCPDEDAPAPFFVLGWDYKDGWEDLEEDGEVTIIVGHQGAWMVPIGVRGDGFCVPADPTQYDATPRLELRIEAEGHPEPIAAVHDFPVSFEPIDEGGLGYTFIPMIIADALDVYDLEGVPTALRATLVIRDGTTLEWTLDGALTVSE